MQYPLRSGWSQLIFGNNTAHWKKLLNIKHKKRLNTVSYKIKKKMFLGTSISDQSFFMRCHFTKIFVHLLITKALSSFNVYNWKGGTQQIFACSKPTVQTLEKGVKWYKICSKLTINAVIVVNLLLILNYFIFF